MTVNFVRVFFLIILKSACHTGTHKGYKGKFPFKYSKKQHRSLKWGCLRFTICYVRLERFAGLYQIANKDDIEKGIIYLAEAVKCLFERVDVSDPLNFQKIYQFGVETRKKLLEKYYLETDFKKAEEYWKSKEYDKTKELFEKNIKELSKSQLKKLEYIRNKGISS